MPLTEPSLKLYLLKLEYSHGSLNNNKENTNSSLPKVAFGLKPSPV